jgi:hypothetical protein
MEPEPASDAGTALPAADAGSPRAPTETPRTDAGSGNALCAVPPSQTCTTGTVRALRVPGTAQVAARLALPPGIHASGLGPVADDGVGRLWPLLEISLDDQTKLPAETPQFFAGSARSGAEKPWLCADAAPGIPWHLDPLESAPGVPLPLIAADAVERAGAASLRLTAYGPTPASKGAPRLAFYQRSAGPDHAQRESFTGYISEGSGNLERSSATPMFRETEHAFGLASYTGQENTYLFACTPQGSRTPCFVARAPLAMAADRGSYAFFTGTVGDVEQFVSQTPADAVEIFEGSSEALSVTYNNFVDRFMAVHANAAGTALVVRTAPRLWGPWSESATLALELGADGRAHHVRQQGSLTPAAFCDRRIVVSHATVSAAQLTRGSHEPDQVVLSFVDLE